MKAFAARARRLGAILCALALVPGYAVGQAPSSAAANASSQQPQQEKPEKISPEQLDSLVAPIALYPDPMLAQTLAASTYPLEIVQLQQWLEKNKNLKDKALVDAVAKEPWDPSVQAMAALPEVVKRLANDIQWTTDLGNAFLAQQSEVMDAVQRMRKKAQETGNLKSGEQQKVETKVEENKSVIVIEQANPQVVYVPTYDPVVVYGAPVYPYPPIYYPPPGYYAAGMAISFGVGVAMGAAWSGGWGWGCRWGGNTQININTNNNFNRNTNVNRSVNRSASARSNTWQHNPQHRGGAPYRDRATADRYGGAARGDPVSNRQAGARQQANRQGGTSPSNRPSGTGAGTGAGARGADNIGGKDLSRSDGGNRDAFSGGTRNFDGASTRANSSRGASSVGSRSGGTRSGGGGRRR